MDWKYNNKEMKELSDFPQNCFGFIYKVTHKETGKFYIGKKQLKTNRKKKLGKKELLLIEVKPGRRPTTKQVIAESDWITYWGSSKELNEEIKKQGLDKFERVIIQLAYDSRTLTYYETMYQMKYDVLRADTFNGNILGKFHRKDFII